MKLFQLLPKKLYDFACNLPLGKPTRRETEGGEVVLSYY